VELSPGRALACSAPARANLIGNPSDQYGGSTLACTVPLRARVELAPADATVVATAGEEPASLHALAEEAREIERSRLGVTCGYVDQYLCTFGGFRFVEFAGKSPEGSASVEPFASVEAIEAPLPFVLAFTGKRHSSDSVHRPIRARWLAGEPEVRRAMERAAKLGRLGTRALLRGAFDELGAHMNENHALVRAIGGSGAANERLIAAALAAGALGAKLAGAGDGGTIVALWPEPDAGPLEHALRRAGAAELYRPALEPGVRLEAPAGV